MVGIQDLLGVLEVEVVLAHFAPGQLQHKLQIVVLHAVVGRIGIVFLKLGKLLLESLADFLGPLLGSGPLAELGKIFLLVHTELLLDSTELAVEVVFPLLLVDFALDLLVDILLEVNQLYLHVQDSQELHSTHLDVVVLKQFHLLLEVLHLHGRGDEIDQELEIVDGLQGADGLARAEIGRAEHLHSLVLDGLGDSLDVSGRRIINAVAKVKHTRGNIWVETDHGIDFDTLERLKDRRQRAVGHLQGLEDAAHRTIAVQVIGGRIFDGHFFLRHGADIEAVLFGILDQTNGLVAADGDRIHRTGKKGGVAKCQHRQHIRQLGFIDLEGLLSLNHRDNIYILLHIFLSKCQ